MEGQTVTKATVNTAWWSTAHQCLLSLAPSCFSPCVEPAHCVSHFLGVSVTLVASGLHMFALMPLSPHTALPHSQPCSPASLSIPSILSPVPVPSESTVSLTWLLREISSQFCLHSHRGEQGSCVSFLTISANLTLSYGHKLSGNNCNWETTKQIPLLCVYVFLWWSLLPKPKKSSSLLTGKLSLECCSEQSVSSTTDFCDSKMFFAGIYLHHRLPPSHLKAFGSLRVIYVHPYCFGAILSFGSRQFSLNTGKWEIIEDVWSAVEDTPLCVRSTISDRKPLWERACWVLELCK